MASGFGGVLPEFDRREPEALHVVQQIGAAGFDQDPSEEPPEVSDVAPQRGRHVLGIAHLESRPAAFRDHRCILWLGQADR